MTLQERETAGRPIRITIAKDHARLRTLIGVPGEWSPIQPDQQPNKKSQVSSEPAPKPTA